MSKERPCRFAAARRQVSSSSIHRTYMSRSSGLMASRGASVSRTVRMAWRTGVGWERILSLVSRVSLAARLGIASHPDASGDQEEDDVVMPNLQPQPAHMVVL